MGITPRDPAHFDPAMGDYKDLKPFRMWCQKVLPLVYDDSLSYYEVLCKLVDYLNKTMEDVGVLHNDVDALHEAYQLLQAYVNDYFSTLDVQEEINNKLDVMASDGTLDALILPYFNAYKDEINSIVDTQNQNLENQFEIMNTGLNNQTSLINQNTNNINTLSARMDTFSKLPSGSTAGDAELADIRIDINGNTYNNAGTSVRSQVEGVNDNTALLAKNKINFGMFGDFVNGCISIADGMIYDEGRQYKYRICSPSIITIPYDSTFTVTSGFIFTYFKFVNGVYTTAEQNLTSKVIPKNEQFKITIQRTTENTDEIANVFTFLRGVTGTYAGVPELNDIRLAANGITYNSAGNAVRAQDKTLDVGENILANNKIWLRFFSNFINGALSFTTGEYLSGYNYRVCSDSIMTIPFDCTIKAKNGFNFHIFKYVNNVYQSSIQSLTTYNISAGDQLKICIMRITEDTSEVADIDVFCSSVLADNAVSGEIQPANYFHDSSNWVQGSISGEGEDTTTNLRIRTGHIPYMKSFHYTFGCISGYQYVIHYYDKDGNILLDTSWITTDYDLVDLPNLSYIRVVFAPTRTREILTSECTNFVAIIKNEINNTCIALKQDIDNLAGSSSVKDDIANNNIGSVGAVQTSVFKAQNYGYSNKIYTQFLITTDVHSDWDRLNRAFNYGENNSNVNMTLCLGDVCDVPNQLDFYNWGEVVLTYQKPIIPIIGNHDAAVVESAGVYKSDAELFNYFFNSNLQAHNGETHNADSLYWYKDVEKTYTDAYGSHTKTVRVIGMNMYELADYTTNNRSLVYLKQDQINWLIGLLESVTEDMSVVILCHTAPTSLVTRQESVWSDLNNIDLTREFIGMSNKDILCSIVDAWINGTNVTADCSSTLGSDTISVNHTFEAHPNQFIAWLGGHSHADMYCVPTNYPTQKVILFNCTSSAEVQQNGDIGRNNSGKSQDCITLFSYDWDNNNIRLVRLGADYTIDGRHRVYAVI